MKKLFFSAVACIAFAGSAFASNEVVNENEVNSSIEEFNTNCSLTVTYYSNGKLRIHTHEYVANSKTDCNKQILAELDAYAKKGINITESSTCYEAKILIR